MGGRLSGRLHPVRKIFFYCAAFIAAFLLFQVQPMMSKSLLPVFGGSYLVWAACVMFFQALLLLGYLYVHAVQGKAGIVRYGRWHWILLLIPLALFPFRFTSVSNSLPNAPFILAVPYLVLINVGLPFFMLSTMSVILQSWFYKSDLPGKENPYFLYGSSNLGSMLALLTYPVLFEPFFDLEMQGYIWWAGYLLLLLFSFVCLPRSKGGEKVKEPKTAKIEPIRLASWFALSAAGCVAMLGVTNIITFDLAPVPFLWIIPMAIYLLTFVLVFRVKPWFPGWVEKAFSWAVPLGIILYLMSFVRLSPPPVVLLILLAAILFVICLNCHGRLVQIKPRDPRELTSFYLMLALGGFAGGILVSTMLPLISNSLLEYPLAFLVSSSALVLSARAFGGRRRIRFSLKDAAWLGVPAVSLTVCPWLFNRFFDFPSRVTMVIITIPVFLAFRWAAKERLLMALTSVVIILSSNWTGELCLGCLMTKKFRNFYGIYRVYDFDGKRHLQHGTTLHGRQYLSGPKADVPLSFFHPTTPAGELLSGKKSSFKDIGMIGLGTGALSAYAGDGDSFTIYELDKDCQEIAEELFSYTRNSRKKGAKIEYVFDDGRISLSKAPENKHDLLILDAFNSGSIPVHLLTVNALKQYLRALKPGGLLLLHISNRALNLAPILYAASDELKLYACEKSNAGEIHPDADLTEWMAITESKSLYEELIKKYGWNSRRYETSKSIRPWTDRYSNLFGALR
jgi:SAM-dependent methyltransferase